MQNNTTITTCGGTFYDNGGPAGNYSGNRNWTMTFCSATPGACIRVIFSMIDMEENYDSLYIYNGPTTASPLLAGLSGVVNPGTFTSTTGCLTFRFKSDASFNYAGWVASISCVNCTTGGCLNTVCAGLPPSNDACSGAINLGSLPTPNDCSTDGLGAEITVTGSTLCATAESPYSTILGCQPAGNMASPAADVWYSVNVTGNILNYNLSGMTNPNIGLWQGLTCGAGMVPINCAVGTGGVAQGTFTGLANGQYFLQISGGSTTDQCDFVLKLKNDNDCNLCVLNSNLTVSPLPVNGVYAPGTAVNFCFTIANYNQAAINWLHGVVPTFGNGWDMTTLTTNPPATCATAGTWSWYNNPITSTATGGSYGPGFFFETAIGNAGGVIDANPGNNYGDNNPAGCGWTFCWTIKTKSPAACVPGQSLNVNISTYGDATSGSWTLAGCNNDLPVKFTATTSCCQPPLVVVTNPLCAGAATGSAIATGQGAGPWIYVWKNSAGTILQTSASINTTNSLSGLAAGNYTVTTTDGSGCSATSSFTVTAPPPLTLTLTPSPVLCNGGNTGSLLSVAGGGTPAYTYTWSSGALSGSNPTNVGAGTYTLTVTDSKGCTVSASGTVAAPTVLTANIATNVPVSCFGGNNGSAIVTAAGGSPAYTYLWSNGSGTATAANLIAGTYTVTVTDNNGCTKQSSVTITQPTALVPTMGATSASCGSANGTASVSVSGGIPGYTYNWTPAGGTGSAASGLSSGAYQVLVTDSKGCTVIGNVSVPNTSGPTASISATQSVSCFGLSNGSATATASGGALPYTYSWSSGSVTNSSGNVAAGTYTVTITDASGCTSVASATIPQPAQLTATVISNVPASCNGGSDGSLTVQANGGTPAYAYSWSNGAVATSITALPAGSYSVTITDSKGCTAQATANISQPTPIVIAFSNPIPVLCNGGAGGGITANAGGGTSPYSYLWSNGSTFSAASNLTAGTYTVTVTDGNGCTAIASILITEPPLLTASITASTNPQCNGLSTGTATAGASGGTLAYSYSWNPGGSSSATATGLAAGTYQVVVTDQNGCTATASAVIAQPPPLTVTAASVSNVFCNGGNTGAASVSANGGSGVVNYLWSTGSTAANISSLVAGTYTVTATDANGCSSSDQVIITQPLPLAVSISQNNPALCAGTATGSLTASATNGNAPYTYSWSNGSTLATDSNLTAGTYTVTVTDANGCTANTSATITQPAPLNLIPIVDADVSCQGANDAAVQVISGGGTLPYTYLWSNGATTAAINGLAASTYTVTVTDANGCSAIASVSPVQPPALTLSPASSGQVKCFGGATGFASVLATGGTTAYAYQWSTGSTNSAVLNLAAGNYTATVTDANGCTASTTITISQPPVLAVTATANGSILCNGGNNAGATASPSGGTAPYSYLWSNGNTTSSISNLAANTYTVTVTDANGCTAQTSIVISQPTPLAATISPVVPVSCNGGTNGSATVVANGGSPAYSYSWSNGITTASTSGLAAGTYTVTVTDANGCTTTTSAAITQPVPLNLIPIVDTDVSCQGGSDAAVHVTSGGGTVPYTYLWSTTATTAAINGLAAGTYTVTVTDANGCSASASVSPVQPPALILSPASSGQVLCFGGTTGFASVMATGGTTAYAYLWSNGSTNAAVVNLAAGNYTATVTDANGCTASTTITISQAPLLTVAASATGNILCAGGSTGAATATPAGGTAPYTYLWNNGNTSATVSNLNANTYSVTITDANGCTAQTSVVTTQPTVLNASIAPVVQVSCNGLANGSAGVSVNGGTPAYTYAWSNGNSTAVNTGLAAGTYTVTVTDANGCTTVNSVAISQPSALTGTFSTSTATCGTANGNATITPGGGTAPYAFLWSTGSATNQSGPAVGGAYSVTITDANGCTLNLAVTIPNANGPTPTLQSSTAVSCNGGNDGSAQIAVVGGSAPYTYLWSPAASTSNSANGLSAGNYQVTVTDANGCTSSVIFTISEPALLVPTGQLLAPVSCFGGSNGSASVSVSGGTSPYTYLWSNGTSVVNATGLSAGTYTVTVTDSKGCTALATSTVTVPAQLVPSILATQQVSCPGGNNGSISIQMTGGTAPFSTNWSNGATGNGISGLTANTYTATVTDANGCTASIAAVISQPSPLVVGMSATVATCGAANGSATATVSGGTGPYTYLWPFNGNTAAGNAGLAAGTYTVNITDANGCTALGAVILSNVNGPTLSSGAIQPVSCFGGSNGAASVLVVGGTSPLSYQWSPSVSNTSTASNLSAGNYTITVTDGNACTASLVIAIGQPTQLTATATQVNPVSCNGTASGAATVVSSGGSGAHTYLWSNGNTAANVNGLAAGNYTVTITDQNACTGIATVQITEPSPLAAAIGNVVMVSCNGAQDGSALASASGGTTPYTYLWSNGQAGASINNLAAGSYTVTVTDAKGCTAAQSIVITEPAVLSISAPVVTAASCFGTADGSIQATVAGGTAPYVYLWSNGATLAQAQNLVAGTYTLTVTDAKGCVVQASAVVNQPAMLLVSPASVQHISCFGVADGSIQLTTTGGNGNNTFQWTPAVSSGTAASNLVGGMYVVHVTDQNGCTASAGIMVNEPPALQPAVYVIDASCFGATDGQAQIHIVGGTFPFTYQWLQVPSTNLQITNLAAGLYTATVTDANGCSATASNTVLQPAQILLAPASTDALCGQNNGTVSVSATGGAGTYTYLWSTGATSNALTNLSAGSYTVTVSDNRACSASITIPVNNVGGPSISILNTTDVQCYGGSDGSASIQISGGNGPFTSAWTPNVGSGTTVNNLTANQYAVAVTDVNGCISTLTLQINEPSAINLFTQPTTAHCGQADGTAAAVVNGGTAPYTYTWSGSASTASTAGSLLPGSYTVTVTDAHSCTSSSTLVIGNASGPSAFVGSIVNVNCAGGSDGSALVQASGGTAPYVYQWSNGTSSAFNSNLSKGLYTVTVSDQFGCSTVANGQISEPAPMVINMQPTMATCGASNGSAEALVTGGTAPYQYTWSGAANNSSLYASIPAGSYTVTVTDAHTCTSSSSVTVSNAGAPTLSNGGVVAVSCAGSSDGSATVTVTSGNGPFTYNWSPAGGTAATATNLAANGYTVTVTDVNGCTASLFMIVTEPAPLTVSNITTDVACNGGNDGTALIDALGGTPPYTYNWSSGGILPASRIGLVAGNYNVTVTDDNGCAATTLARVLEPTALSPGTQAQAATCNGSSTGSIQVNASGGVAPYTYNWGFGSSSSSGSTNLAAGTYTVTVSDNNGCSKVVSETVTEPSSILATVQTTPATCGSNNASAIVNPSGGNGGYSYLWSNGLGASAQINNVAAANYTVVITDVLGCTETIPVSISSLGGPVAVVSSVTNVSCNGGTNGAASVNVLSGNGPYTYLWTPTGGNAAQATNLTAGVYSCQITDINGCITNVQVNISQPAALLAPLTVVSATCGNSNGSAVVTASGGQSPYTYMWSTGATVASISAVPAGTYTVTVTDAAGCSIVQSAAVQNQGAPTAFITSLGHVNCNGGNNGFATVSVVGGVNPITYSWTPGGGNTATATGLTAGNYTVQVTDANGCFITLPVKINEPTALTLSLAATQASCGLTDAQVVSTASGGAAGYTYQWTTGATTFNLNQVGPGNYTLTVTDANGCSKSASTAVTAKAGPSISIQQVKAVTCSGGSNGSIAVLSNGGTGPYQYQWSAIGSGNSYSQLPAGTYTITVTDAGGCSANATATVTEPPALVVGTQVQNASCDNSNGSAQTNVNGGTAPYAFLWNTGNTSTTLSGIPAGVYTVIVTDQQNCSAQAIAQVNNIGAPVISITGSSDASCYGGSNGSIQTSVSGGTAPLQYQWTPSGGNQANADSLTAGSYTLTVTDANGCVSSQLKSIAQPAQINLAGFSTPATCNGANGSAYVLSTGGTGLLSLLWNTGSSLDSITGLVSGVYAVSATDANGCTASIQVPVQGIGGPQLVAVDSGDVNCHGGNDGFAEIAVVSGVAPYQYSWYPVGGNAPLAQTLPAGQYTVTVQDANGCQSLLNFRIDEPAALNLQLNALQHISCYGLLDGVAQATASGGTAPYQYNWSSGSTNAIVNNLAAGNYVATVSDANGCSASSGIQLNQPSALVIDVISADSTTCFGQSDGSTYVQVSGGTSPYQYVWSNGTTLAQNNNVVAGIYAVTISDQHGCTVQSSISVLQPTELKTLTSVLADVQCYGQQNGAAIVQATGGVMPYQYLWSNGQNTAQNNLLAAGNYTATVTDAHGCSSSGLVTIQQPDSLWFSKQVSHVHCYGESNGSIVIQPNGGTTPYSIQWNSPAASGFQALNLPAGYYQATISDGHQCQVQSQDNINSPAPLLISVSGNDTLCIGQESVLQATTTGGTSPYQYLWSNGSTKDSIHVQPTSSSGYAVVVSDQQGCTSGPALYDLFVYPALQAQVQLSDDTICYGEAVLLSGVGSGGNGGPYTYNWSSTLNGSNQQQLIPDSSQSYILTIQDGCGTPAAMAQTRVTVMPLPMVDFTPANSSGCAPYRLLFNAVAVTEPGSTYQWNFGDQNGATITPAYHTYTQGGVYDVTLTVTSPFGCISSETKTNAVKIHEQPVAAFTLSPTETSILNPIITCINNSIDNAANHWTFGDGSAASYVESPVHSYRDTGNYTVRLIVINQYGCKDTTYAEVIVRGEVAIYIPNAFTPNDDFSNDSFTAYGIGIVSGEMTIYDRWGDLVYRGDLSNPWKGISESGKICQQDTYVYRFILKGVDGSEHKYTGRVTLIR